MLDAAQYDGFHVHADVDGYGEFFPPQRRHGRIRFDVVENVRQNFKRFRRLRFCSHAQRVFFFVIAEAAPGGRILREDDRPLILVRDGVQSIGPRSQRLPFDGDVIGKHDRCILVRPRTPHFPIRHGLSPDFTPAYGRPVVRDCDVRQSDPLQNHPTLTHPGNAQLRRLASILELRFGIPRPDAEPHDQTQNTLYLAHKHTISSPDETDR